MQARIRKTLKGIGNTFSPIQMAAMGILFLSYLSLDNISLI